MISQRKLQLIELQPNLKISNTNTKESMQLAKERNQWRAFVNAAINLWISQAIKLHNYTAKYID